MTQLNLSMKHQQNQGHREQTGACQGEGRWERLALGDNLANNQDTVHFVLILCTVGLNIYINVRFPLVFQTFEVLIISTLLLPFPFFEISRGFVCVVVLWGFFFVIFVSFFSSLLE